MSTELAPYYNHSKSAPRYVSPYSDETTVCPHCDPDEPSFSGMACNVNHCLVCKQHNCSTDCHEPNCSDKTCKVKHCSKCKAAKCTCPPPPKPTKVRKSKVLAFGAKGSIHEYLAELKGKDVFGYPLHDSSEEEW